MPEAAMHKDDCIPARQHDVRSAGQIPVVQPVTQTSGEEPLSQIEFGSRVLSPDSGHHSGPDFRRNYINQRISTVARGAELYRLPKTLETAKLA